MIHRNSQGKLKFHISLNHKIVIVLVATMIILASLWTTVMFLNMSRNAKDIALNDERTYIRSVGSNENSVEEVCNLAKQTIVQQTSLYDYMQLVKSGKDLDTVEKIEFYNNEIASLDNMTNTNPYLYQIRLFVNAPITEKKPCFYRIDRLKNLAWAASYQSGAWEINYTDTAFPNNVNYSTRLAAIVTDIYDENNDLLAVLEVSTNIENIIPNFYSEKQEDLNFFIDSHDHIVCSDHVQELLNSNKKQILEMVENNSEPAYIKLNDKNLLISTLKMTSLNGTYVHITTTDHIIASYYDSQAPYIFIVVISMIIFSALVVILIRYIFRRFNNLTTSVKRIKNGERIMLPTDGNDEVSDMAMQINDMLSALEQLNEEKMNRELLAKNAEIKALQNQINAHFMFNVLETIKMLAEIREDYEISDAVTSLGEMFRYTVKWSSGMVELKEEINYIKNYLDLLNLRFDYEINLSLNIPEEYMTLKIPKMSLQPLVENSVSHGIENVAEDTTILIQAYKKDELIYLEVLDEGVGISMEQLENLRQRLESSEWVSDDSDHGRALFNVMQRIKMYFGAEYGLQIFSEEGKYTKVLIQIPRNEENVK